LKIFANVEKPVEYVTRNLGRYAEKIHHRNNLRKTPQSRTILTGAKIADRLINHVMKGGEKDGRKMDNNLLCGVPRTDSPF
jgi:hypothetical protein